MLADDPERIAGVARCVRVAPGAGTAEFAIVVGDPLQGLGLGTALTRALGEAAARGGHPALQRDHAGRERGRGAADRGRRGRTSSERPAAGGVRELLAELPRAA